MSACVLWGCTGQAKVIRPIVVWRGFQISAVFDNGEKVQPPFDDVPLVGGRSAFEQVKGTYAGQSFVACIGGTNGRARHEVSTWLIRSGLSPIWAIHQTTIVSPSALLGKGVQILAGAIISEEVEIGDYCIINTGASVDHECSIGIGVHLMPQATLAGLVRVDDYASVGTNATILPRIRIGKGAIVGAGAVVTRDVADGEIVVGCPARTLAKSRGGPR